MTRQYAAGFIDGEGTITVHVTRKKSDSSHVYVHPVIQVANTHRNVLLGFKREFGGKVYLQRPRPQSPKTQWVWVLYGTQAVPVLRRLLPLLIVKKKTAKLVLTGVSSKNRSQSYLKRWAQTVRRRNGY